MRGLEEDPAPPDEEAGSKSMIGCLNLLIINRPDPQIQELSAGCCGGRDDIPVRVPSRKTCARSAAFHRAESGHPLAFGDDLLYHKAGALSSSEAGLGLRL